MQKLDSKLATVENFTLQTNTRTIVESTNLVLRRDLAIDGAFTKLELEVEDRREDKRQNVVSKAS